MKKKAIFFSLCFLIVIVVFFSLKGYSGKYVQWGDSIETVNTKTLKENNIPYKIKNNKVYIPEDAFDKATLCCS
ncbi:hypothetical protein [Bacillus albus]|uniref:hypothetical protein n=1 Tax=Bacillus albus TaxID=2026189 RepID=UPI0018A18768|nr:hypothetical protein [Bacillus albus]MBF7156476.1 hypothetical protein [Bacillus albus]